MNEKLNKLAELLRDENNVKELVSLTELEDAQKWISDHGIEMTVEEVRELGNEIRKMIKEKSPEEIERIANGEDVELTDDQLAQVSGGFLATALGIAVGVAKIAGALGASAAIIGTIGGAASWLFGNGKGWE